MTIFNRPDPQCDVAYDKAFEAHYDSEWITQMPADDCRDLLLRMWITYTVNEPGPLIWKHQRVCDVLTGAADKICKLYAEEHRNDFVDDGEEF